MLTVETVENIADGIVSAMIAKGLGPGDILLILAKSVATVVALSSPPNAPSHDASGRAMVLALVDEEMLTALRAASEADGEEPPPASPSN